MGLFKRISFIFRTVVLVFLAGQVSAQENGHLHHVHMNVSSVEQSLAFYQRVFGTVSIKYNEKVPALLMERAFLLMEERPRDSIENHLLTGLTHISWGADKVENKYQWLKEQGVEFYSEPEELLPGSSYMYLYGPDREVIEIFDYQAHHRFNHIHLLAEDAEFTARWFEKVIHPEQSPRSALYGSWVLNIDNVSMTVFPIGARFTPEENDGRLRTSDNSHLDHLAFSFRDLDAAYARIKQLGVEILKPISVDEDYGFRHFFLRAPNGILLELVEATPWPQAAWE